MIKILKHWVTSFTKSLNGRREIVSLWETLDIRRGNRSRIIIVDFYDLERNHDLNQGLIYEGIQKVSTLLKFQKKFNRYKRIGNSDARRTSIGRKWIALGKYYARRQ